MGKQWLIRLLLCGGLGASVLSGGAPVRAQAPEKEGTQKSEDAFRAAQERLKSPVAAERATAADEMGRRGHRIRHEVAGVLRPLLVSDPSHVVRAAAGRALGRLGVREALPDLVAALSDTNAEVRVVAAAALWRLPDASAVGPLLSRLVDTEAAVREWSAQALGVIGDHRATPEIAKLLTDPTRSVRLSAVLSLGRIGDPAGLRPLVKYATTGVLDDEEKTEVVNAVVSIKGPQRVEALFELLTASGRDPAQRVRLLLGLGQVANAEVIPRLRVYTAPTSVPSVRKAAQEAVAAIEARAGTKPKEEAAAASK